MKSSVNQIPLVHACYKDMQHRSKHNSIIWAWHNWAKLKFLSDIHWLNTIQYFIAKLAVFWHISTKLNGLSCLAGLLSGPCSFLLPDVQTWICTVHTQDLKPTVLPQYIDEMRSRSGMAKKTHSHSPPLSFFFQVLRFWVLKWVLKWYLPLLKKNKKNYLKNLLVETSACQKKTMRKSAPQKNTSTWGESKKHCTGQSNTAKTTP